MSTPRQRSSSASSPKAKRNGKVAPTPAAPSQTPASRPAPDDRDAWKAYWAARSQPWRTEPEIDEKRQAELEQYRATIPDPLKGIYSFKGVKLNRADVEWLLATHEHGRGPVDWRDEKQHDRKGLDLRGADLCGADLRDLPLTRLLGGPDWDEWDLSTTKQLTKQQIEQQLDMAGVLMRGTNLNCAQLQGAFLSGARLQNASLREAQLQEAYLEWTQLQRVQFGVAQLQKAVLFGAQAQDSFFGGAQLQEAILHNAHLERANLGHAHLQQARFIGAHLQGARFERAQLQDVDLEQAQLQNADFREAQLQGIHLGEVQLSNKQRVGPRLADAQWGDANLAVVDWSQLNMLGDEDTARQKVDSKGKPKSQAQRLKDYQAAVRANRQLAVALQAQGLNEDAARFAYRAQLLQKTVSWSQVLQLGISFRKRTQALGAWLFSWFLFLLAGYGYKPGRSFLAYLLVIGIFMALYLGFNQHLAWYEALVVSMTAFHGRGFSPSTFSPGDPLSIASAIEAFVGLIIEVTFIATLTQRFFNR